MRIAMFSDTFHPAIDGVVSSMDAVSRELIRRGHAVRMFVPEPKTPESAVEPCRGLDVFRLPSLGLWTYDDYRITWPFASAWIKACKEFKPDVIHVHSPCSVGFAGMGCARRLHVPMVATYHTLFPEFLVYLPIPYFRDTKFAQNLTWQATAMFYNRADLVTTPTQRMADSLEIHHKKPAVALSNPIRYDLFHQFINEPRPKDRFRLLFFGRISYEKNVQVVIDALKLLLDRGRAVDLWLMGSGPAEKYLRAHAAKVGVEDSVTFLGPKRGEELAKAVASCHCLVTASTIETQGLAILEAMSAGLPCVGADRLAIPETVIDDVNGYLFPPYDAKVAADGVDKMIASPELYAKLSAQAGVTAKPFSTSAITDRYLELLEDVQVKYHQKWQSA